MFGCSLADACELLACVIEQKICGGKAETVLENDIHVSQFNHVKQKRLSLFGSELWVSLKA